MRPSASATTEVATHARWGLFSLLIARLFRFRDVVVIAFLHAKSFPAWTLGNC